MRQSPSFTAAILSTLAACNSGGGRFDFAAPTDAASLIDSATPRDASAGGGKLVFITSAQFPGSLTGGGGLAGGDSACNAAAQAAHLGGAFQAWLSTTTVNAIDRVRGAGPFVDTMGTTIFPGRGELATSPITPLWYDENGAFLASDHIWTGTGFGGTYLAALTDGSPCGEWTSSSMSDQAKVGQVGMSNNGNWTAESNTTCDQSAHLICFHE